ncbi:MAG: YfhO family protein [Candidatus Latescibacterota bacterium]|nr:YfhO family protein [Candidatus Latescibacterota bacterium]
MGGLPSSEEIRPQYFPTYPLYFFTSSFHRYIGWRYIITMFVAGWGMFLFLRQIRVHHHVAMWGGVAYMSAPTLMGFTYAGQYAKMGVIALYPLMWLMLDRGLRRRRFIDFVGLGVLVGWGLYSPHPKMLYYALCGIGLYFVWRTWEFYKDERHLRLVAQRGGLFAFAVVLGLGLGAEGTFPLYVYTSSESKRAADVELSGRSESDQLLFAQSWSLHPEEVVSLIVPEFGGFNRPNEGRSSYWGRNPGKDNSEYFGILVVFLALVLVPDARRRPFIAFLCGGFLLALAYTLGGHTPVHWFAYHVLPGLDMFRAVGMAAFLFAFPACVLAALALDALVYGEDQDRERLQKRLTVFGTGLVAFTSLIAVAPSGFTDAWIGGFYSEIASQKRLVLNASLGWLSKGALYVSLTVSGALIAFWLQRKGHIGIGLLVCLLGLLTVADTWRISSEFLKYVDPKDYEDVRISNSNARDLMRRDGDLFRVLPLPDYQILRQSGFSLEGIPSITGFHDLTVGRYDHALQYIQPVTGLLWSKYAQGKEVPYSDDELLSAIQPMLNLLNGKYIVVPSTLPMELDTDRFPLVGSADNYTIFRNPSAMPWVYTVSSIQEVAGKPALERIAQGEVDLSKVALVEAALPFELDGGPTEDDIINVTEHSPTDGVVRVSTQTKGPRLLVLSENYQANWSAYVDGEKRPLVRANYVWKGVAVPAGSHEVEFRYQSANVLWSRAVMATSLLVVFFVCTITIRRRGSGRD